MHFGGARAVMNDHNALHDSLTGLPNRAFFRVLAEQAISARSRDGGRLAVMVMDLDRFKEINDGLGHRAGDLLLCEIGPRIEGAMRRPGIARPARRRRVRGAAAQRGEPGARRSRPPAA